MSDWSKYTVFGFSMEVNVGFVVVRSLVKFEFVFYIMIIVVSKWLEFYWRLEVVDSEKLRGR